MGEALPDGVFLHAGKPQARERLFAACLLVHQPEDEFALTSGIATVHDAVYVRAVHQLLQNAKLLFGGRRHQIMPLLRQDGQICDTPLDVLGIVDIGRSKFHQMTNAPADEIAVALPITILSIGRTEDLCVSCPDRGLFRHYQAIRQ